MDMELAHPCCKLEVKYANGWDMGYTYVTISGESIPLTVFKMKEWACAMHQTQLVTVALFQLLMLQYDGQATEYEPPHTATFGPANCHASLCIQSTSASTSGSGSSGQPIYSNNPKPLAHVSHIVLSTIATIMGKVGWVWTS